MTKTSGAKRGAPPSFDNSAFVLEQATKRAGSSKTACAILANRLSKHVDHVDLVLGLVKPQDDALAASHLHLVSPLLQQGLLSLAQEQELIRHVCEILPNCSSKEIAESCFGLLLLLVSRKENRPLLAEKVPLLLPFAGGPVITELLMGIIRSDSAAVQDVEQRLEQLVTSSTPFTRLINDPVLQELAMRDFEVFETSVLKTLVKHENGVSKKIFNLPSHPTISDSVEPVLDALAAYLLAAIGSSAGRLDLSSGLICLSAMLSDLAKLGAPLPEGNEIQRIQKKIVHVMVKDMGRKLVILADLDEASGISEALMKQVRQWADCINQASGFIAGDVLLMVRDELAEINHIPGCSVNVRILTNYAYGGLVFLLTEGSPEGPDSGIGLELTQLFADRLEFGVHHLCRSDANLQIEALLVGIHQLLPKHSKAAVREEAEEPDAGDDGDDEEEDEGDDEDEEDGEDDDEEDLVDGLDTDRPEDEEAELNEILAELDEEAEAGESQDDDVVHDIDVNREESEESDESEQADPYCNPDEESSSDDDHDDEEDNEEDDDMYGDEWDDDENYSYDDVDWEEDEEEDEENESPLNFVDDDGLVLGEGDNELNEYMSSSELMPSPLSGPEPMLIPTRRTHYDETVARTRIEGVLGRLPEGTEDTTYSDEEDNDNSSQSSSHGNILTGLAGLSLEERLSIQQALEGESDEEEWVLPQGGAANELVVEMPGDMDPRQQATLLAGMINSYTAGPNYRASPATRGAPRKVPVGNFPTSFDLPDQIRAEELCVLSTPNPSLIVIAKACIPVLFLRNHYVPMKPAIDRILFQIALDSVARNVLLDNLLACLTRLVRSNLWTVPSSDTETINWVMKHIANQGLFDWHSSSMDLLNSPAQARTVGSGRIINTFTFLLNHVPRVKMWFGSPSVMETCDVGGIRTPEKKQRLRTHTPQTEGGYLTSSDGEGPLVRRVVSMGQLSLPSRKVTPLSVMIKLLATPFIASSPSHALIVLTLVLAALDPKVAVSTESVEILCDFLTETKNRLRHMPEFDKAMTKASMILVDLARDVKMREVVRQKLAATATRLVGEMLAKLSSDDGVSAAPLVRVFKTAREAFGIKRVEAGEMETYLDFAAAVPNIAQLWDAMDMRLAGHSGLLLGLPSIAQQALQKAASSHVVDEAMVESPTAKIATLETISKLIPLVEVFLIAHDVSILAVPKESVALQSFVERHRRPINAMIKSRPSLLNKAFAPLVAVCSHLLDFDNKRAFFRTKLRDDRPAAPIKLTVRREDVFRDSYAKLQVRPASEWRGKLSITFQGEEGVDAGGLVREWFGILAREIFNPNYALFLPASGRPSTFVMNPASCVNPDHIHYFRFCGRFIGKAVYDNQRIDAYFVRSVYKHMLGKEVTWRDMETTDPEYFKNLNWILENDMSEVDYYSFTVEENEFGKLKVVELLPGGEQIRVTEGNKQEYVRLVCEHKLTRGFQDQLKAFLQGFHELCPKEIVGMLFDDKELEMLISGLPSIDIEDLRKHTDYVHYTESSDQIKWFWKALESFTPDELAWFLQFVTGSTQVPLEGFKGLAGMNGPQRFSIHRIKVEDRLPTAHTCFNQLDLPEYPSYQVLETKLKQAVREGHSGFGFI